MPLDGIASSIHFYYVTRIIGLMVAKFSVFFGLALLSGCLVSGLTPILLLDSVNALV